MKLTAKTIDSIKLPPGPKEVIVYDEEIPGFGIRIREGGSRNFVLAYRFGAKHRRLTLGPAVKDAFPDIRKRALDLLAKVRLGTDPAAVAEANREAAKRQQAESFKAVADLYLAKQEKDLRPRTYQELDYHLTVKAKSLHARPIASITRRDIAELLTATETGVSKGTGASTANRLRAFLSAMFTWAMKEGLCEANPVAATNKRAEQERDRVLSMGELVAIWRALPDHHFGRAVKLLILTGQRRNEVGGIRWSELNSDLWTLPAARAKNDREHLVPLSAAARDVVTQCNRVVGWDCVFSSTTGLGNWGYYKAELDAKLPDMPHWTLHDIRRSVATHMAGKPLSIQPHIIEAILNHISGHKAGVAGIYNRASYLEEKIDALARWAQYLMIAVSGENVVQLRA